MMLRCILSLFLICSLTFLLGCEDKKKQHDEKKLIMVTSADYPPFEFLESGEIKGFEIDLAKAIAEDLGYKLEIKDLDFAALIPALNSQHSDFVMAALTPNSERKKYLDFSDIYYQGQLSFVFKKDNICEKFTDLAHKTVGVQIGSVWEKLVQEKSDDIPNLKIKSANRIPQLVEELRSNMVDIIIIEKDQAQKITAINPEFNYHLVDEMSSGNAIAFRKGSPLRLEFNQSISRLKANGKIAEIAQKWLN